MKLLLWMAVLAAGVSLCRADEVRACPPWQVTVVDEEGRPVGGCSLLQEWNCRIGGKFYSRSTNSVTDAAGCVTLPERWLSVPASPRRTQRILDQLGAQPSPDPTANLFVWKRGYDSIRVFSRRDVNVLLTRDGFQSKLVLRPEKSAR